MPLVAFDAGGPPTLQVALGSKIFHLRQSTKPLAATNAHTYTLKSAWKYIFFWVQWILNTTYERFIHVYFIFKNCLSRLKIVSITSFKLAIGSDNSKI